MKANTRAKLSTEGNMFTESSYKISHEKVYFSQIYTQLSKPELDFKLYK